MAQFGFSAPQNAEDDRRCNWLAKAPRDEIFANDRRRAVQSRQCEEKLRCRLWQFRCIQRKARVARCSKHRSCVGLQRRNLGERRRRATNQLAEYEKCSVAVQNKLDVEKQNYEREQRCRQKERQPTHYSMFAQTLRRVTLVNGFNRVFRTKVVSNDLSSKMAQAEREKRRFGEPFVRERLREDFDTDTAANRVPSSRLRDVDVSKSRTTSSISSTSRRASSAATTALHEPMRPPSEAPSADAASRSSDGVPPIRYIDSSSKEEAKKNMPPSAEQNWSRRLIWLALSALLWLYARHRRNQSTADGNAKQKESLPVDVEHLFSNILTRDQDDDAVLSELFHSNRKAAKKKLRVRFGKPCIIIIKSRLSAFEEDSGI